MRILAHVASKIVSEVSKVIDEEVIVINRDGHIIAASVTSRIGSFHQGGKEVIQTKQKLMITKKETERFIGVQIGLNLPIRFQNKVIGVIGITGSKPATTRHGELIQRMTELIIEEAYAAEKLDSKLRGLETFVYEWLHSEKMPLDLFERGEILGIDMKEPRYCVIVQLEKVHREMIEPDIEVDVFEMIRTVFPNEKKDLLVRWGRGRFALLVSAQLRNQHMLYETLFTLSEKIEKKHLVIFKAGSSRVYEDSSRLHRAYEEAKKTLYVRKNERIVFYNDLSLELALSEMKLETKKKMIDKVLGNLMAERELLETLQAYFDFHLSIKETAAFLHVHINTLHYRLKRIQELSGCDLKVTKELVTLYIALWHYNEQIG
ncbi:hypothetical protein GN156_12615 [bacterium LRH843]|nr:hypothetical protein [bacterium LRH843]